MRVLERAVVIGLAGAAVAAGYASLPACPVARGWALVAAGCGGLAVMVHRAARRLARLDALMSEEWRRHGR